MGAIVIGFIFLAYTGHGRRLQPHFQQEESGSRVGHVSATKEKDVRLCLNLCATWRRLQSPGRSKVCQPLKLLAVLLVAFNLPRPALRTSERSHSFLAGGSPRGLHALSKPCCKRSCAAVSMGPEDNVGTSTGKILILGGGVIGVSIAYHLALRDVPVTLVDRAGIASCASGKAGGFLARNWNDFSPVGDLTRKSFDMHEEVAQALGLKSYRRLTCKGVGVDGTGSKPAGKKLENLEWTDLGVQGSRQMGDERTIAQVLPKELVDAMWSYAEGKGSTFTKGVVEGLTYKDAAEGKMLEGAIVDGQLLSADKVVCTMGPWGRVLQQALPRCQMYGIKYHSVLMRTGRVLNEAVFFSGLGDPEVYPRNDGDTYVTGFPDPGTIVDEIPGEVEVREDVCERLVSTMQMVSSEMKGADVTKKQSCYLPFTVDNNPCMGLLPGHANAYVATGHGCWGILNSLASGLAMSELILDGSATSVDLAPFSPARFA
mmetsp:Transcript_74537/g.132113  ORF Transcript_74537/g.132113 Transcript_74537/m.132113 type:complete len:486 (-) Transcript_74537:33-1490(-)